MTRRQLADFLADGIYGKEVDDSLKEAMKNCPITNLSEEHAFGNLDYDLGQRHNCSIHNRSTRHMQKWNDGMAWLNAQTPAKRAEILLLARRKKGYNEEVLEAGRAGEA